MDTYIEIEFFEPSINLGSFRLKWRVLDRPYCLLWLRNLIQSFNRDEPPFFRFTGFIDSPKNLAFLSKKLNEAIDIINLDGLYQIKEKAGGSFSQEFANVIHHHFEVLMGDAKNPSKYYRNSSPMGKGAICDLNQCIHDMEALTRSQLIETSNKAIVLEFLERKQYWLKDEYLLDFTMDIEFGDICLHYGLIGKTWWEVFLDNDDEIFPEAIRPLDVLGPEFDIQFSGHRVDPLALEEFKEFLIKHGQDPSDPKLALGFLRLAELVNDKDLVPQDTCCEVGKRSNVKSIKIFDDQKVWLEKDLEHSATSNRGFFQIEKDIVLKPGDSICTREVPIQAFFISGAFEDTVLSEAIFKGPHLKKHSISLLVPSFGNSVVLKCSSVARGLNANQDITLRPGENVHLDFNTDGSYNVIKKG